MNNYSEQIFQSIDTIISQRLNEVKFDRTITCEVIAGVKDYPNKYWVSDGATKFQACVADSSRTYTEKQKVYVLIPNGDYNSTDKVIIGSYTADELPKNLYTNPFDHLVYSSKVSFGPYALDKYIETSTDTENLVLVDEQEIAFDYSTTTPFDYIGLNFSFNTTDLYGMKKGNYGIQFALKNNNVEIFTSAIDSSQLYGDIYNFNSLMKMQHLFPIPAGVDITQANELIINLYQKGNFDIAKKRIYLKEASFYFGYDVEKIDSNKLILYLDKSQSLTFKETKSEEDLKRKLYLEWQDTNLNKIYSYNNQEYPSNEKYRYTVYWCKYMPGYKKNKKDIEETGVYWQTIEAGNSFTQEVKLDPLTNTQQFKVGVKYRNQEEFEKLINQRKEEINAIIQDTSLTEEEKQNKIKEIEEKYQKLIDALWKYIESNALIFTNEDVKAEPGSTNNSEDSIKLTCSDSGVYNYYTSYGKIIDSKYKNQKRTITAAFLDGYNIMDTAIKVKWSIVGIDETNQKFTMINQKTTTNNLFTFTIKDNYIPGIKDQNTILCEASLSNGEIRRGKITLRFGEANSAGSQYAFNIDFPDNVNCLYIGDTTPIEMKYTFESRSGETIEEPTVIWSWLNDTDHGGIILDANNGTITAPIAMPNENHAVLVATIEDYPLHNGLQTDLKAYLPIPLSADKTKYQYMSGPTYLVYNSTGSAVLNYSKENYVLYPVNIDDSDVWKAEDNTPNTPQLSFKKDKWYLQPLALAPNDLPVTCLKAIKDPAGNNTIIWSQPIFSTRERWDMDALNDWNGTFLQDTKKNRLFAATIAAGGKNAEDNTFSGVLMGQSLDPTNKTLEETGLYGIDKGIVKYYLNNAGAFFVGDGNNYISFNDANKGTRDAEGNATFAVNVNKLLLNTPQTKIISSKPNDSLLDTDALRVKLGWIKDDVYGLDIYNGAFRMYGVPWNKDLTDEDASIYFVESEIDNTKYDLYLNGQILRKTKEVYVYSSNISGSHIDSIKLGETNIPYWTAGSQLYTKGLYIEHEGEKTLSNKTSTFGGLIIGTDSFKSRNTDGTYANPRFDGMVLRGLGEELTIENRSQITASSGYSSNLTIQAVWKTWGTTTDRPWINLNADGLGTNNITLSAEGSNTSSRIALYGNIYTNGTLISSSDANLKKDFISFSEKYDTFFDNLNPILFRYKQNDSNRLHSGFISQEVEKSLNKAAISTQDFAGFVKMNSNLIKETYALRYSEFIALNTWQIQKLKQRVTELENEIKEIKQNENN